MATLGALIVAIPLCWIIGLLGAVLLGEPLGIDLGAYHGSEHADAADHIRYTEVGFVIVGGAVWITRVCKVVSDQLEHLSHSKRRLEK